MDAVKAWTAMESCGHDRSRLAWTHLVYHECKWSGRPLWQQRDLFGYNMYRKECQGLQWTAMDPWAKIKCIAMDRHGSGWMRMEDF